jgi:hypothetical protein
VETCFNLVSVVPTAQLARPTDGDNNTVDRPRSYPGSKVVQKGSIQALDDSVVMPGTVSDALSYCPIKESREEKSLVASTCAGRGADDVDENGWRVAAGDAMFAEERREGGPLGVWLQRAGDSDGSSCGRLSTGE